MAKGYFLLGKGKRIKVGKEVIHANERPIWPSISMESRSQLPMHDLGMPVESVSMESHVRCILCRQKTYMAERKMLAFYLDKLHDSTCNAQLCRLKMLDRQLEIIDCWLLLLSEDEVFVVRRHLIEGIDWPRITLEYEKIWGAGFAKSERSLRRLQQAALRKIAKFTIEHEILMN